MCVYMSAPWSEKVGVQDIHEIYPSQRVKLLEVSKQCYYLAQMQQSGFVGG